MSECDHVQKLWFGFNSYIQTKLWKDKLNPEQSSLKSVIAAAEIIEIANSISTRQDHQHKFEGKGKACTANDDSGKRPDGHKTEGRGQYDLGET